MMLDVWRCTIVVVRCSVWWMLSIIIVVGSTIPISLQSMTVITMRSTASALCKASGSQCHETFLDAVRHWSADEIDLLYQEKDVPKTPVHMAAWKGCLDNLRYLIEELRCDINVISTGPFSYGKTPIFFALTQSREDVVLYLLQRGAHVKIINNKGQSPLSIASSHLSSAAVTAVRSAEAAQSGLPWQNYRSTHSDGLEYGDLDPRFFFDGPQKQQLLRPTDHVTEFAINPTTRAMRRGMFRRNNHQIPITTPPRHPKQQQQQPRRRRPPESGLTEQESVVLVAAWSRLETVLGASTTNPKHTTIDLFSEAILQIMHLNVKQRKEWIADTAKRLRELTTTTAAAPDDDDHLLGLIQAATSQQQQKQQLDPTDHPTTAVALLNRLASHLVDPDRRQVIRPLPPPPAAALSSSSSSRKRRNTRHQSTTTTAALATALAPSMDESPWSDALAIVHHLRMEHLVQKTAKDDDVALSFLTLRKAPVWIDSIEALHDLMSSSSLGLVEAPLVAIDTEWAGDDDVLSTLQIAVDDDAWVVDLLKNEAKYQSECKRFIRCLFATKRFIMGFAMAHDLRKLEAFVDAPLLGGATVGGEAEDEVAPVLLDVQKLFVRAVSGDVPGLASCVTQVAPTTSTTTTTPTLSKVLQCSAWDMRPLDDAQLEYAALDAVILAYIVSEKGRRCSIRTDPNGS